MCMLNFNVKWLIKFQLQPYMGSFSFWLGHHDSMNEFAYKILKLFQYRSQNSKPFNYLKSYILFLLFVFL